MQDQDDQSRKKVVEMLVLQPWQTATYLIFSAKSTWSSLQNQATCSLCIVQPVNKLQSNSDLIRYQGANQLLKMNLKLRWCRQHGKEGFGGLISLMPSFIQSLWPWKWESSWCTSPPSPHNHCLQIMLTDQMNCANCMNYIWHFQPMFLFHPCQLNRSSGLVQPCEVICTRQEKWGAGGQNLLKQWVIEIDLMRPMRPGEAAALNGRLLGVAAWAHPMPIDCLPGCPSTCLS